MKSNFSTIPSDKWRATMDEADGWARRDQTLYRNSQPN